MTIGSGALYPRTVAFRLANFILDDRGERTPSGGLKVPARLARTGVQVYHRPDGSEVRELRPAEEVFSADALASFRGAPVTNLHPAGAVTADNWKDVALGHVGDDVRQDGDYVAATLYLQDADLVRQVQDGTRKELSAGYQVDLEEVPGELEGERFDRTQRNIRGNHVATLPPGHARGGPELALRLDASDDCIMETGPTGDREETRTMKIRIDGVDYEIEGPGAEALRQALERRDGARAAELAAIAAKSEEATGRADAAETKVSELETKVSELEDPARLDAAAKDRAVLIMDARTVLRDAAKDFGASTTAEIMKEALGDTVKADASEDYLRGAFHVALKAAKASGEGREDHLDAVHRAAEEASRVDGEDPMDKLESTVAERNRQAWKAPLAEHRN